MAENHRISQTGDIMHPSKKKSRYLDMMMRDLKTSHFISIAALLRFFHHLLFQLPRHLFVVAESLAVETTSASKGAQLAGVAIKLARGDLRADDLELAVHIDAQDLSAAAREIAHGFSQAVLRDADFDGMNRFQQAWLGLVERLFESKVAGNLERDVVGINVVHFAVVKVNF